MDPPQCTSTTASSFLSSAKPSHATSTSQQQPAAAAKCEQALKLVSQLRAHVLSRAPGGNAYLQRRSPAQRQQDEAHYYNILGSYMQPSRRAQDEAESLRQARRRATGGGLEDRDPRRVEQMAMRLEELLRRMKGPALAPLLRRRWAVLYLLSGLARPALPSSTNNANASASASSSIDALDSYLSTDLPPAALLPPAGAAASTTRDGDGSSSSSSTRRERGDPPSSVLLPPDEEALAQQQREAAAAEWRLLRDCLYAFQGIDGRHLTYDAGSGTHALDPELRALLSPAQIDAALRMAELGWLFRRVQAFAERGTSTSTSGGSKLRPLSSSSSSSSSSRPQGSGGVSALGLVGQALCFVLQDELTEYYRLIAVLESQLADQQPPAAAPAPFPAAAAAGSADAGGSGGALTLRRLAVWVEEPLSRLRLLATLCDSLAHVRGGATASVLVAHGQHGDPAARQLVRRVLGRVCLPLFDMVRRWILEGELADPYHEFFVAASSDESSSPTDPAPAAAGEGVLPADERLWHHTYHLRQDMVPRFIPLELAQRILVLGKSVAFMRRCCGDREWISAALRARVAAEPLSHSHPDGLQRVVEGVAQCVNARLRSLILEKHQLMTHVQALKKFLALGQGDFVTCLMDLVGPDLGKLAGQVYRHDLTGKLEAALRASNAQYEQPDVLNRLGVRLLEASAGEDGWEVFSLDYQPPAPLSAIIHSCALSADYARIFHLLWRIKRVEWSLAASWKDHMVVGHLPTVFSLHQPKQGTTASSSSSSTSLGGVLQICNLARREMAHFVANLSSFMMFEVLEASWTALQTDVGKAPDLDALVAAHDAYLRRIADTAFLRPDKARLHGALQAVLSMILEFCALHSNLCADAMRHHRTAAPSNRHARTAAAQRDWDSSAADEETEDSTAPFPHNQSRTGGGGKDMVALYARRVAATTSEYQRAMGELLTLLRAQEQEQEPVRHLMFRLDFNSYYAGAGAGEASGRFGSLLADEASSGRG